jgi:hypothetical protein
MEQHSVPISIKGSTVMVPAVVIRDRTVAVTGTWFRVARFHEEEWKAGNSLADIDAFITALREAHPKPDIFSFSPGLEFLHQKFPFRSETEDAAVVRLSSFDLWWESLPQEARKNVRRSERRGLTVRAAAFDDMLVSGIKKLYDETPVRQGRRFWHYGKDVQTIRAENSSFLDRSEFIGAYFNDELIGFIKVVYVGKIARIMQILSANAHYDKRPANALLAKAIENSCHKGMSYFVYGRYFYGNKGDTPITEFKRRNGFERIIVPRYFVPLTAKGRLVLALNLHQGVKNLIPRPIINSLLDIRSRVYSVLPRRGNSGSAPVAAT